MDKLSRVISLKLTFVIFYKKWKILKSRVWKYLKDIEDKTITLCEVNFMCHI